MKYKPKPKFHRGFLLAPETASKSNNRWSANCFRRRW